MLCSAAPEKVSALNLKRLKADNKTCEQPQDKLTDRQGVGLSTFCIWNRANSLYRSGFTVVFLFSEVK